MAVVACRNERIKEKEVSERSFVKVMHFAASVFFFESALVIKFVIILLIPDQKISRRQRIF